MVSAAQAEGWGQFFAATNLNNKSDTNCTLGYYKEFRNDDGSITNPPMAKSCFAQQRWMANRCAASSRGTEWDWMNHDMAGNAFEWTNDRYLPAGYGAGPLVDPVHGVDTPWNLTPNTPIFMGMRDGTFVDGFPGFRIRRSGAFDLFSQLTGSGRRDHGYVAGQHTGLRIARTLPHKPGAVD